MKLIILITLALISSCSLFKASKDDYISRRLNKYEYDTSLKDLKGKVKQALVKQNSLFDGPAIMLSVRPSEVSVSMERAQEIEDYMRDGFTYNKKLYKAKEFELSLTDFFKSDAMSELKAKLKNSIKIGDIHLVKDSQNEFIYVKGATVISAKKEGSKNIKLNACTLMNYRRAPMQLGFDLTTFATNGFNLLNALNISKGPISLEKSMSFCRRDRIMELVVFYEAKPDLAKKWMSEIKE